MKLLGRTFALSGLIIIAMVLFQNCGRIGFNADSTSTSGLSSLGVTACDNLLKQTYSRTYFPLLSVSCNRCHSTGHGSTDLDTSFAGFMSKGVSLIDYKATHPHGDNGIDLSSQISALKPAWNEGQTEYSSCVASASSGSDQLGFKLKLESKIIPNLEMTRTKQTQWQAIEWDLDTEGPQNQTTLFGAILKLEARYFMQQGTVLGIEFRNPSMRLKATGKNVQVTGLNFYLDQKLQSNVTTYENVSAVVTGTTATPLAPGAGSALVYDPDVNANTLVGIEIENIKFVADVPAPSNGGSDGGSSQPPAPTPVTFSQLTSTDPMVGVFKNNCLSCHSGATPAKGLDLSNYTAAKDASSLILMRMNDSAQPMPPSGILPQAQRDVVSRWVSGGSPQ